MATLRVFFSTIGYLGSAFGLSCCDAASTHDLPAVDPSSESCGACHAAEYEAWRESPHGRSSASPVFRALVDEVRASWGDAAARRCEGCHAPGHDGSDRIGCVTCHQAVGHRGARDGLLVVDAAVPVAGPGRAGGRAPHAVRRGGFLASAELCGTCHEVTGPRHFVEPTLTEFLASPQAASGQSCISCHLAPGARGRADHGLTALTPAWGAPAERIAARREDAAALVAAALQLELVAASAGSDARVRLSNVGAAHAVPTGASLVRQFWVEVRGAEGATLTPITLGARLTHSGQPVALPTEADAVSLDALGPGAHIEASVALTPPLEAVLYFRPYRADAAEALGFDPGAAELAPVEVARARLE